MYFTLRPAAPSDLPILWSILDDYKQVYLDDFLELNINWLSELIQNDNLFCIDACSILTNPSMSPTTNNLKQKGSTTQYPVGVLWISEIHSNLHGQLHFLLRPEFIRCAIRQKLFQHVIQFVFDCFELRKIKVRLKPHQSAGIKLLRQLGFYCSGYAMGETSINNQPVDILSFELRQKDWEKHHELR